MRSPHRHRHVEDARRNSTYLCTDATGVLVQDLDKCRRAHFFVVVAPEKHVLFGYSTKHDSAAVDRLLAGFTGKLVADAHSDFNHLYESGDVIECGCWAHTRRYFFKALSSDAVRANHALELIRNLFALGAAWATAPPKARLAQRQAEAKPLVDGYARNQREALQQFLTDGRGPIDNNISERALPAGCRPKELALRRR